ncbi:MAG: hypothetical protein L3J28_11130 [Candidatus Polarisedimenticolaceae bacterium]|nr:hypothetical protein [Candidatus Polarisedimenticolaceae bacterium]
MQRQNQWFTLILIKQVFDLMNKHPRHKQAGYSVCRFALTSMDGANAVELLGTIPVRRAYAAEAAPTKSFAAPTVGALGEQWGD